MLKNHNSCLHIFGVISLRFFFHTILCLLYSSKTIRDFSVKHGTLIKHDETMCHAQEKSRIITLAFISLELFPFDYFPYNFVPTQSL